MPQRLRNEDLAFPGLPGDARGHDDRGAEEVAIFFDGLARVEADAYVQRLAFVSGERSLECDGAIHRLSDRREGGHKAIAYRLHLRAAVLLEKIARDALVLAEDFAAAV